MGSSGQRHAAVNQRRSGSRHHQGIQCKPALPLLAPALLLACNTAHRPRHRTVEPSLPACWGSCGQHVREQKRKKLRVAAGAGVCESVPPSPLLFVRRPRGCGTLHMNTHHTSIAAQAGRGEEKGGSEVGRGKTEKQRPQRLPPIPTSHSVNADRFLFSLNLAPSSSPLPSLPPSSVFSFFQKQTQTRNNEQTAHASR